MAYADSPTNLIWRLHNDMTPVSKAAAQKEEQDGATFTDITLDVVPPSRAQCRSAQDECRPAARRRSLPLGGAACKAGYSVKALRLTEALIARPSVTPDDGGCQSLLGERLQAAGFALRDAALRPGELARHQPVGVAPRQPPGADAGLRRPHRRGAHRAAGALAQRPFRAQHRDGHLYGRGAADMKTSIAAMVVAAEEFVQRTRDHAGAIAFLLTSDEEGPSVDGTVRLVELLQSRGQTLDACIVGEPTSVERLGDMIKNGRRGTLSGRLHGQGHPGPYRLPAPGAQPDPRRGAGAGRAGGHALGRGQ